ncbi:MAG: stage III sporulation protein AG [Clostridiaceae bacterium]|nr:stage III sporulation protein AG [Clostridiaceae bacterium]
MFSWFNKLTDYAKEKKGKRRIENLVIILIVGIIIIIVASSFTSDGKNKKNTQEPKGEIALITNEPDDKIKKLEQRLESILSEIEGAGTVKVMVTGITDGEVVHAYNQIEENSVTEEKDNTDRTGRTDEYRREQEMVFMEANAGGRVPVIIKSYEPEIKGVVVVADGAGSSIIRQNIKDAVAALTGLPAHKINVLKRK